MFSSSEAWNTEILGCRVKINCKWNSSPGAFTSQVYFYYNFQFKPHTQEWGGMFSSQQSQRPAHNILPRYGGTSVCARTDSRKPTQPNQWSGRQRCSSILSPAESVNPERPIWLDSGLGYIYRSWVETSTLDFTNICLFILRHSTWERNIYPVLENCLLSYLVLPHRQVIFIVISLCLRKWGCFILCHRYWASYPSPTQSRILRLYQASLLSLVTECWQLPVRIQSQKPSGFGGALEVFYHL